jgi:hypothetical protein
VEFPEAAQLARFAAVVHALNGAAAADDLRRSAAPEVPSPSPARAPARARPDARAAPRGQDAPALRPLRFLLPAALARVAATVSIQAAWRAAARRRALRPPLATALLALRAARLLQAPPPLGRSGHAASLTPY